jgi:hypothetical protein
MHQVVKSCSLEFLGVLFVVMSKFSDEKIEDVILYVAGLNSNCIENDHPFCQSMMKHEPIHICPMAWSTWKFHAWSCWKTRWHQTVFLAK